MNDMRTRNILAIAGLVLCIFAGVMSCAHGTKKTTAPEQPEIITTEAPTTAPSRSLTITAVGDCTLGTDISFNKSTSLNAYADKYGTEYFLSKVKSIFAEDDLTIVNFEGTLSERGTRVDNLFAFRGDPSYVDVLTSASVEAANLANNHTLDYGIDALNDTRMYIENAGILTCRGKDNVTVTEINGIKVGLVGINYLNDIMRTELEDAIAAAKSKGAELIILSIHWGEEKRIEPTAEQKEVARRAIDCGADVVLGAHPHVLEGIEKYKGRYILYSMGNFCFGGNSSPSDMDTMIWRQTFTFNGDTLADDDNFEIIPARISGTTGVNNYQPVAAEGADKERIINRLNTYTGALGGVTLKFR